MDPRFIAQFFDVMGTVIGVLLTTSFGSQAWSLLRLMFAKGSQGYERMGYYRRYTVVATVRDEELRPAMVAVLLYGVIAGGLFTYFAGSAFVEHYLLPLIAVVVVCVFWMGYHLWNARNIKALAPDFTVPTDPAARAQFIQDYGTGYEVGPMVKAAWVSYFAIAMAIGVIEFALITFQHVDFGLAQVPIWLFAGFAMAKPFARVIAAVLVTARLAGITGKALRFLEVSGRMIGVKAVPGLTEENEERLLGNNAPDLEVLRFVAGKGLPIASALYTTYLTVWGLGLFLQNLFVIGTISVCSLGRSIYLMITRARVVTELLTDDQISETRKAELRKWLEDQSRSSERVWRIIGTLLAVGILYLIVNAVYMHLLPHPVPVKSLAAEYIPIFRDHVLGMGFFKALAVSFALLSVLFLLNKAFKSDEKMKDTFRKVTYGTIALLSLFWLGRFVFGTPERVPAIEAAQQRLERAFNRNTVAAMDNTTSQIDSVTRSLQPLPREVQQRLNRLETLVARQRIAQADANALRRELNAMSPADRGRLQMIDARLNELEHPVVTTSQPQTPAPVSTSRRTRRPTNRSLASNSPPAATGNCYFSDAMVAAHPGSRRCDR